MRDTLLDVLSDRFGQVPVELVAEIALATDLVALRHAIRSATKVADLADFRFNP